VQAYGYDRLNRLNAVGENNTATGNSFDWSQTFDYDRYGNMWMTGVSGLQYQPLMPTTQSAINAANNRLVAQSYDAAGNQTSMGSSAVTYDAENRQVSYGGTVTYAYDGNGQRVSKTISGGTTTVYAHDVFGNLAAEHVTGSGGATPPCVTCYLSWDHLGSSGIDADGDGCERDDSGAA
jgi:YD repeat-containing protein